jgi:hypothetical protein
LNSYRPSWIGSDAPIGTNGYCQLMKEARLLRIAILRKSVMSVAIEEFLAYDSYASSLADVCTLEAKELSLKYFGAKIHGT